MIQITDQYSLEVQVEGESLTADPANFVQLKMTEGMDYLMPTFRLDYRQFAPFFHDFLPLTGMQKITVELTNKVTDETVTKDFRVTNSQPNKDIGDSIDAPAFTIQGLMDGVTELKNSYRRSLSGLPSDVVQTIVNPITRNTKTEQSASDLNETWIQPGWSNAKMLRYLQSSAYSTDQVGTYRSFFRYRKTGNNNYREYVFKTLNNLMEEPKPEKPYGRLVYGPQQTVNKNKSEQSDSTDNKAENIVVSFQFKNDIKRAYKKGGFGKRFVGYNREEGEYQDHYTTPHDESDHNHLGTHLFQNTDYNVDDYGLDDYSGRIDSEDSVKNDAEEHMLNAQEDMSQVEVTVDGYLPRIHAGTKVNLIVNDSSLSGNTQEVLSGNWLVRYKSEYLRGDRVWTVLELTRLSINQPRANKSLYPEASNQV